VADTRRGFDLQSLLELHRLIRAAAQHVDGAVAGCRGEPGAGVGRHAIAVPRLQARVNASRAHSLARSQSPVIAISEATRPFENG